MQAYSELDTTKLILPENNRYINDYKKGLRYMKLIGHLCSLLILETLQRLPSILID